MRVKGKIISWNDDRGFGFVAPSSGERQIFIHISDFESLSRQPKADQVVSYIVSADKQGRPCGKSVLFDGDRLRKRRSRISGLFSFFIVASFVIFAGQSSHSNGFCGIAFPAILSMWCNTYEQGKRIALLGDVVSQRQSKSSH